MRHPFQFILLAVGLIALAVLLPPEDEAHGLESAASTFQRDVDRSASLLPEVVRGLEEQLSGSSANALWKAPATLPEGMSVLLWDADSLSYWS